MRHDTSKDVLTRTALAVGIAIPVLYYGIQSVAAPFFTGFSFIQTTASELGSERSQYAGIFNYAVMALGFATLIAACGFFQAFQRLKTTPIVGWLTSLGVAMCGVQCLWGGYYPLPDPRHGGHPAFLVTMLLLPVLIAVSMWRFGRVPLRVYLIANLVLLAVMVPLMSGLSGLDTHAHRGLLQRVFALTIFPPIGVAAYVLSQRITSPGM